MNRLFSILLNFACLSLVVFSSSSAFSQNDVSVVGQDTAEKAETTEATHMLSIDSPVAGYQPLSVAGSEIDAAYIEETFGQRFGAVVLLHDVGKEFETRDVITPLRHSLPKYGWSTLTLTLDLPSEATVLLSTNLEATSKTESTEDVTTGDEQKSDNEVDALPALSNEQRIQAALAFLEAKEIKQIVFLGHGDGGRVGIENISQRFLPVSGLILVNTPKVSDEVFQQLNLPIFDIYGSKAITGTEEAVKARTVAMKRSENTNYLSRKVIGANHVFYGLDDMLNQHIKGWLKKMFQKEGQ